MTFLKSRIQSLNALVLLIAAKMKSLKFMIQFLMALVLLIFAVWLSWKACMYLKSLVLPGKIVVIMPFEGGDKQKASAQAILSSKFRSLRNRSKEAPAGYGLFSLPLLDSKLLQTQEPTNAIGVLDDIEFKIKDVNLGVVVKAFNSLLAPAHYELRGTVSELPGSVLVTSKLMFQDDVLAGWESEVKGSLTDQLLTKALDEIVYQMIYDFMNEQKLEKFKITKLDKLSFQNWQGLQSYINGLSALRAYQMNLDTNDLKTAFESFDKLALIEPDEPLGLYFRGLVQSEKRQEAAAVNDFEKLQRLLQRKYSRITAGTNSPDLLEANPAAGDRNKDEILRLKKMLFEAKLNEATSRLKLYNIEAGKSAAETLRSVIDAIRKDLDPKETVSLAGQRRVDAAKAVEAATKTLADATDKLKQATDVTKAPVAKARIDAEKAVNSANEARAAADTKLENARKNVVATDAYLTKLLALCQAQLGYTHGTILSFRRDEGATKDQVRKDYDAMNQSLDEAQSWYETLDDAKAWNNERERRDVHFRISNARGYGRFRYAYFLLADSARYHAECDAAIEALSDARADRPDHYEVLQNLGMIYNDSNYDPQGRLLQMAQDLFEFTKRYVPDDYYQYEQLALIHWRRVVGLHDKAQKKSEIDAGRAEAKIALEKRSPDVSASVMRTLSRLAAEEWSLTDPRDKAAATAIQAFRDAEPWCLADPTFLGEYVSFLTKLALVRESLGDLKEVTAIVLNISSKLEATTRPAALKPVADVLVDKARKAEDAASKLKDNDPTKNDRLNEAAELTKVVTELNSAMGRP